VTEEAAPTPPAPPPPADGGQVDRENPWPGLPSFREQDQELFFGREAETESLRRTVMRESTRATVLFGRSGLGKTSLLQAGLFPLLRRQEVLPVALRLVYAGERGSAGADLVGQVREAILAAAARAKVEAPALPPHETLWESLHRAGANFWSESNRIVVPLLVFDQFEEIFTLGKQDPARREAFLAELADLVEGRPPAAVKARLDAEPALAVGFTPERHDYKILFSLRQDFLADLDGLRSRMRSLGASRLALLNMNGEAALRVVTRAGGHLIEPAVAEKVVRFVAGAGRQSAAGAAAAAMAERPVAAAHPPGDARQPADPAPLGDLEVDPTLLSLVCRELNNRRRERGQPKITFDLLSGSWKEILTRFYDNSLSGLAPAVRTFVEDRLLTRSGYRDCIAWDNAITEPGVAAADLLALRDRRLLRFEERHGVTWIELTHDVLTEVIGESRELRRQREARRQAETAMREADERERQARAREHEAQERERETRRLLARSRKLAVVLGAVLLAAIALAVLGARLWRRSEAAERRAERALFGSAANLIEKGRDEQALAYLASIMRSSPRGRTARDRALDVLLQETWPLPVCVARHDRAVTAAELSPDGERLLTASTDGTARLWRVSDGAGAGIMRHGSAVSAAAFSPDGTRVLTFSRDGTARIWDARDGAPVGRQMKIAPPLLQAAWSPRGDRVLITSRDGARLWDAGRQEPLPGAPLPGVTAFSPDGRRLLVARAGSRPSWIDLRTGAPAGELALTAPDPVQMALSRRGDRLLIVDGPRTVRVWDLLTSRPVSVHEHKARVTWAELGPDGRTLLTVSVDRVVRLWNLDAPAQPATLLQHARGVVAAHYSPDGRSVLTASRDMAARVWDVRSGELDEQPLLAAAPLQVIGWSRDGLRAVTAASDGAAKVWDLRLGHYALPRQLPQRVRLASFDPRGRQVLVLLQDGTARLWDLETGASTGLAPAGQELLAAAVLPDGRVATIALGAPGILGAPGALSAPGILSAPGALGALRVPGAHGALDALDAAARRTIQVRDGKTGQPMGAAIADAADRPFAAYGRPSLSADGSRLLWRGPAGLDIWDARTASHIAVVPKEAGTLHSGPGGRLVIASSPAGARLWDTGTGRQVGKIAQDHTIAAELRAEGQLVGVASADKMLRLFTAADGRAVSPPLAFEGDLTNVLFSRDAARVVTTSLSGEVKVSDVASGRLLCALLIPFLADPHDKDTAFAASLSADGKRLVARSPEGLAQIWDVESCQELSEPLWHQASSWVTYARFSPEGSHLLTLDNDGSARVWDLPETAAADSELLADLAEAVAGLAVDPTGNAVPLSDQVDRLAQLRARAARPDREPSLAREVLRWFFAPPAARTLSPFSSINAAAAAALAPPPALSSDLSPSPTMEPPPR
jgi:WD40 repeat protein